MRTLFFLSLMIFPISSVADVFTYSCSVNGEYALSDAGKLIADDKLYIGSKFNVDRKSGVVLGDGVGNSSYPTKVVIDPGSKVQSYKLVWISKKVIGTEGGHNAGYLSIEEFNENIEKPFTLVLGARILSGICN